MKPRLLVATSVHEPDDPRIRERYIRTLESTFDVTYVARAPGPTDQNGLSLLPLEGSRRRRRGAVRAALLKSDYDVAAVHDPELLPAAIAASRRGRRVVFDLHEDVPAQLRTRRSLPRVLRRPASVVAAAYLRHAEKKLPITLAEAGYASLLRMPHPVFPNYPRYDTFPAPSGKPDGSIVYVGDVTEVRGALTLIEAAALVSSRRPVRFVGRCSDELRGRMEELARARVVDVELTGWMAHREAMEAIASSVVGVSPLHDVPNYRNSLPTKTLEYLAMGVPAVATDLPGTRGVIGGLAGVELVVPGDARSLAVGIENALDPLVQQSASSSAASVRETYVWPDEEVRDFYRSLLS